MNASEAMRPFADHAPFAFDRISHEVFVAGAGPAVILIHELPGQTPEFWRFAHWTAQAGFTAYAPDLYSKPGHPAGEIGAARGLIRACVSREIDLLAKNKSSPVVDWLRALARHAHETQGGPGVGVVGMCMTGNFALSMVLEQAVIAPVASQPSMPMGFSNRAKSALHMSEAEKDALQARDDVSIIALRFEGDPVCRAARFDSLRALIGDRLEALELPDSAQNKKTGNRFPHAVLTKDLIDEDGQPTREAADRVLAFLQDRLIPERRDT